MGTLHVPEALLTAIHRHAEQCYPREGCGIVTASRGDRDQLLTWHPCENAQDRYHALDPATFPRSSANAYFIDPGELLRITRAADRDGEFIRLIVHSHCDAPVYFSAEDKSQALFGGRPAYPHAGHLVVSVMAGKVVDSGLFHWLPEEGFAAATLV